MIQKSPLCGMAALAALLLGVIAPLQATPLPSEGVFVYSSLCRERESGDAAGYRIVLFHSPGRIKQDVGTDEVFHRIENRFLRGQPVRPGIAQIEFRAHGPAQVAAHRGFHGFELAPAFGSFSGGQHANRRDESVTREILHLLLGQKFRHLSPTIRPPVRRPVRALPIARPRRGCCLPRCWRSRIAGSSRADRGQHISRLRRCAV